ncbi:MAG: Rieske (2Fe-2S) protein [Ignavibacteria bacterium]|nr:Rieske (2Fe-2S) protein [Ignavibacteria bacterium]
MDRKEFIKITAFGLGTLFVFQNFVGCNSNSTQAPANVDFTIDMNNPEFSVLKEIGGYVVVNNILVFRDANGNYGAVSSKCTHEQTTLEFNLQKDKIICPKHNSAFAKNGQVLAGPARKNLIAYNVEVNGNVIRIFSK